MWKGMDCEGWDFQRQGSGQAQAVSKLQDDIHAAEGGRGMRGDVGVQLAIHAIRSAGLEEKRKIRQGC